MTITTAGGLSAFLSALAPPPSPKLHVILNKPCCSQPSKLQMHSLIQSKSHPLKTIPLLSSTSSSIPFVEEEEDQEGGNDSPRGELVQSDVRDGGCKACGREEIEGGCNGEGRIQGGIATVPGFGWWPIKAYRPCPAYLATGGRYKRRGQTMDEVTSGRIGRAVLVDDGDDKASKGKQGPKKVSL